MVLPDILAEGGSSHRPIEIITGTIESSEHEMVAEILRAVHADITQLKRGK